jgi:hypothetical protein
MDVEVSKTNPSCIGLSDGTAAAIVYGGTGPYSYNWSTGETSQSINNLAIGNYTVTVSDAGSCTVTVNFSIEHAPVIEITSNVTATCEGTDVTFFATQFLGGTNPQYQWQVNGVNVGTNDPTYVDSTLNDGDVVTAIITSNDTCVSTPTATSNPITITIFGSQIPVITQNGNTLSTVPASHHQWFYNGNPLPGDTTQTITIDSLGDYYVMITDSNGCQAASEIFTVTVIGISSIEKINFNTFPVPASDYLNFILNEKVYNAQIKIIDQQGRVVFMKYSQMIYEKYKLNISDLEAGIYFMEINSAEKRYLSKFIKQ